MGGINICPLVVRQWPLCVTTTGLSREGNMLYASLFSWRWNRNRHSCFVLHLKKPISAVLHVVFGELSTKLANSGGIPTRNIPIGPVYQKQLSAKHKSTGYQSQRTHVKWNFGWLPYSGKHNFAVLSYFGIPPKKKKLKKRIEEQKHKILYFYLKAHLWQR